VDDLSLKDYNKRHLAQLAKEKGITGWHAMRKDQLIRALSTQTAASSRREKSTSPGVARRGKAPTTPATPTQVLDHASQKDRIIVFTRDSYWLYAYWELSRSTLARARAALGQEWHSTHPILRVMDVSSEDSTSAAERHVRDIPIHGGVNNWYIDVLEPPRSYRIDIGYLSRHGRFHVLARSNVVTTPKAGVTDTLDENWTNAKKQFERISNSASVSAGSPSYSMID
jgi:hypothetical protein